MCLGGVFEVEIANVGQGSVLIAVVSCQEGFEVQPCAVQGFENHSFC